MEFYSLWGASLAFGESHSFLGGLLVWESIILGQHHSFWGLLLILGENCSFGGNILGSIMVLRRSIILGAPLQKNHLILEEDPLFWGKPCSSGGSSAFGGKHFNFGELPSFWGCVICFGQYHPATGGSLLLGEHHSFLDNIIHFWVSITDFGAESLIFGEYKSFWGGHHSREV